MRQLKLQVQITVNGFIAGVHGEMDWTTFQWDPGLKDYVGKITDDVDCILLGRKLAEGFIPYWTSHPQEEGAPVFIQTPKVVFSKTLKKSEWDRTRIHSGDLAEEVLRLKQETGKNLIAYGGAGFVSSLIQANLIDEYFLFVNPAALPTGLPIFQTIGNPLKLQLLEARGFDCGISVLRYKPLQKN